ncbi:MAG TPA: hypothetical protein V6C91_12615 [Coleofasciculaceae cyanobacterium]
MIPPASIRQKWSLLAIAALFPVTLMGVSLQEQTAQARQPSSGNESAAPANGVYLYGNSPQPNQLTRHYVVFERRNGAVVGAFYSPQSEFTCFAGDIQGTRLEVEALVPEEPETQQVKAQLANLYPLQRVSANDQRMVAVCKQQTIALASRQ